MVSLVLLWDSRVVVGEVASMEAEATWGRDWPR
jgi:hypothetical protein